MTQTSDDRMEGSRGWSVGTLAVALAGTVAAQRRRRREAP